MLAIKDPQFSNDENQQFASENNDANNLIINSYNDSAIDSQVSINPKELDDDTIYDNMIFPS